MNLKNILSSRAIVSCAGLFAGLLFFFVFQRGWYEKVRDVYQQAAIITRAVRYEGREWIKFVVINHDNQEDWTACRGCCQLYDVASSTIKEARYFKVGDRFQYENLNDSQIFTIQEVIPVTYWDLEPPTFMEETECFLKMLAYDVGINTALCLPFLFVTGGWSLLWVIMAWTAWTTLDLIWDTWLAYNYRIKRNVGTLLSYAT